MTIKVSEKDGVMEIRPEKTGNDVDNKLELISQTIDVHSLAIANNIRKDFVLCKLNEKDKTAIIEMTIDAFYSKKIIQIIKNNAKIYGFKDGKHIVRELSKEEQDRMDKIGERIFDSFMVKLYMTAILNRNVKENQIVRYVFGFDDEEEREEEKIKKFKDKIVDLVKPNDSKD